MKGLKGFVLFAAGFVIGGASSWYLTKTKYEQILREEIDEIKEGYGIENRRKTGSQNTSVTHQNGSESISDSSKEQTFSKLEKARKMAQNDLNKPDILSFRRAGERKNYSKIVEDQDYSTVDEVQDRVEIKSPTEKEDVEPYIIAPCAVGMGDYEVCTLNFYADGVLADDMDEPMDQEDCIGDIKPEEHFGEFDDDPDIVYVRNDKLHLDYEIVRRLSRYTDVTGENED